MLYCNWSSSFSGKQQSFDNKGFCLLLLNAFQVNDEYSEIEDLAEDETNIHRAVPVINTPWDGYTSLHFFMEFGDEYDTDLLIDLGLDPLCKAANGDTPVHLALNRHRLNGFSVNLKGLVGCGQNPFGTDGYSLFHVACAVVHRDSIKYFLDIGVDPNLRTKMKGHDIDDKTPLHLIAERFMGSLLVNDVVKLLVEREAKVDARDAEFNTPLHCVNSRNPKIIDVLISYGANINARNLANETPLLFLHANSPRCCSQSVAKDL
ncbi:hypothetical protein QAD02_011449 [Eretmocerus hayati]|uniref:Uncharacterized protein n=1 Tax=Eretmocerus hayati TaxID=131215 RepID=A0ACC2NXS3_9HYME|nr:hypothetical protein QAD02_011449 [Eretmocerus hayati]